MQVNPEGDDSDMRLAALRDPECKAGHEKEEGHKRESGEQQGAATVVKELFCRFSQSNSFLKSRNTGDAPECVDCPDGRCSHDPAVDSHVSMRSKASRDRTRS